MHLELGYFAPSVVSGLDDGAVTLSYFKLFKFAIFSIQLPHTVFEAPLAALQHHHFNEKKEEAVFERKKQPWLVEMQSHLLSNLLNYR